VLDDKATSPALNALRAVAEGEGVVVAILNHTNRENNKATKGETLEAVAALEIVLIQGENEWFTIYIGKNRSGPGHKNIGRVRYTSAAVGDVTAAVVDEIVPDDGAAGDEPKEHGPGPKPKLLQAIATTAFLDSQDYRTPHGSEGPRVKVVREEAIKATFYSRKTGGGRHQEQGLQSRAAILAGARMACPRRRHGWPRYPLAWKEGRREARTFQRQLMNGRQTGQDGHQPSMCPCRPV
jgi:hypothetical protein